MQKDKVINYRNCLSAKCKVAGDSFDHLAKEKGMEERVVVEGLWLPGITSDKESFLVFLLGI